MVGRLCHLAAVGPFEPTLDVLAANKEEIEQAEEALGKAMANDIRFRAVLILGA